MDLKRRHLVLALVGSLLAPLGALAAEEIPDSTGAIPPGEKTSLVRVQPRTVRDLRVALALTNDVWSHAMRDGLIDLRVAVTSLATLDQQGVPFEVLIADVEGLIEAQAADRTRVAAEQAEGGIADADWYADVKTLAQINARMDQLAASHPALVTPITIGTSLQGRPIRGLRLSSLPVDSEAPGFLFNATQHAREWATPMVAMFLAERLVNDAATDSEIAAILAGSEIFILPVINPDGYQFSWDSQRLWRKNRRNNGNGTFGVDLNRNWGYQWGGAGSSGNPASETYRGTAPFSEPETQVLRDFMLNHGWILAHIDYHSYGQLILWPWGYTSQFCDDQPLFASLGASIQTAIAEVHGRSYFPGPIYTGIYPASGTVVDWAYGAGGVLSTTIEVRDKGGYGFLIPPPEVRPCAEENTEAALALIRATLQPGFMTYEGTPPWWVEPETLVPVVVFASALVSTFDAPPLLRTRIGTTAPFAESETQSLGGGRYLGWLPPAKCGAIIEWFFEWPGSDGALLLPDAAPNEVFRTTVLAYERIYFDDFEQDSGWVSGAPGDNATSGHWVLVEPIGSIGEPSEDHTPDGTMCWLTGQSDPFGPPGNGNVDNGVTSLTSPWLDGSDPNAMLRYWRWYSNDMGPNPNNDSMLVLASTDDSTWTLVEEVSVTTYEWTEASFRIGDLLETPGPFKLRFVARDLRGPSLVEAALDDVSIDATFCGPRPEDLNSDGSVDGADLALLLGQWGPCDGCAADLNGDGTVNGADLALLLGAWG
ncbi:MAG: hypothetical protein KF724_02080 [Phycisphaeraceae bacterium]|nr:hypothetical protein [Phycisphaeraceae bacterium]